VTAYVVAIPIALFVARRFPDPRVRYLLLVAMIMAGLFVGLLGLANALCCY
jgi:hypothetical protein